MACGESGKRDADPLRNKSPAFEPVRVGEELAKLVETSQMLRKL